MDFSGYVLATKEDFDYFTDICCLLRNKKNVKDFESNCDNVLEEILKEREENTKKL